MNFPTAALAELVAIPVFLAAVPTSLLYQLQGLPESCYTGSGCHASLDAAVPAWLLFQLEVSLVDGPTNLPADTECPPFQ